MTIMGVGLIQGFAALRNETHHARARLSASLLAVDLREEILSKPARDPDQPPVFGREPGEYGNVRMYLDDRDDYGDLEDNPVTDLRGNQIPGMEKFSRKVSIRRVLEEDPSKAADDKPSRLYQYFVVVQKDGAEMYRLDWLEARP